MTSEEMKKNLADKKVAKTYLQEFEEGILSKLKEFEVKLSDFKPKHEVLHKLGSVEEVNALKSKINNLIEGISNIQIPKEVRVEETRVTKIDIKDRTRRWLLVYSLFSLLVFGVALYIANTGITIDRRPVNKGYYNKALKAGRVDIYNQLPINSQKFLDKKHPNNDYWE